MIFVVFCVASRCGKRRGLMTSLCVWCLVCLTDASPLQASSLAALRGSDCGLRCSKYCRVPKPTGGHRLIALLHDLAKLWGVIRRPLAAEWERLHELPEFLVWCR